MDDGGIANLGAGDDVFIAVYDADGNFLYERDVAVGHSTKDWWPVVGGTKILHVQTILA